MAELHDGGCWRLENEVATLEPGTLRASMDPRKIADGLRISEFEGRSLSGMGLLGVESAGAGPEQLELEECYPRHGDLVAVYELGPQGSVRLEAVWRLLPAARLAPSDTGRVRGGIELILSVHTTRLEDRAPLIVTTRISQTLLAELGMVDVGNWGSAEGNDLAQGHPKHQPSRAAGRKPPVEPLLDSARSGRRLTPPVCLLYTLRASDQTELAYVEAAAPSDVDSVEITAHCGVPTETCVRHAVFNAPLEKGVILRARVRAVFLAAGLPAQQAVRSAAQVYDTLIASDPVLGS